MSFNVANTAKIYVVIALDIDPPFPSFSFLGPALHCIYSSTYKPRKLIDQGLQPNFKAENGSNNLSASNAPFIVDYVGPGPPPFRAPHRYVFLLYEQPEGFDENKFALKDAESWYAAENYLGLGHFCGRGGVRRDYCLQLLSEQLMGTQAPLGLKGLMIDHEQRHHNMSSPVVGKCYAQKPGFVLI